MPGRTTAGARSSAYLEAQAPPQARRGLEVENSQDLRQALLGLRLEQRTAIVLRYYEDLTEARLQTSCDAPSGR